MHGLPDTIVGVCLVGVIAGYVLVNQAQGLPSEAVLAEISVIMNDLESELHTVERSNGHLPPNVNLASLLDQGQHTAIVGQAGDPPLMPDVVKRNDQHWLGGCPVDEGTWVLLRKDYSALTQIPADWDKPVIQLCLDRNGPRGPNMEGYDVIWLSFSRTSSPHITLIPARTEATRLPRRGTF
jgi:hypothetical protein